MSDNRERPNQILEASLKVFAHYGYKKASMEAIAERLGMTKSNLYFYYRDKVDLYEKTVAFALLRWQTRVQNAIALETDIENKLIVLALKSYEYLSEDEDLRALIMNDPAIQSITPTEDRYPSIGLASYNMLKSIIQEGVEARRFRTIDVDQVAGFLYSVYCMFIIKTYIKAEGQSAHAMYRAGVDLVLNGLLAEHDKSKQSLLAENLPESSEMIP